MAATKKNGKAHPIQGFLKEQLADAQKLFKDIETEAEKVLENLRERARDSRKELETLTKRFDGVEQLREQLRDQLEKIREIDFGDVQKRLIVVRRKVVEGAGLASQAQMQQLNRDMAKLTKKVDALVGRKANRPDTQN